MYEIVRQSKSYFDGKSESNNKFETTIVVTMETVCIEI